jgi:subtilisin family serine protease
MSDKDRQTSRRSTLKLVSGAAVGTTGMGTAAAASDDEQEASETTDDDRSQWMLRLDETPVRGAPSAEDAKLAADQSQQPLVETLRSMPAVTVERQFWLTNAVLVESQANAEAAQSELSALSGVRDIHPNFEVPGPEPVEEQPATPQDHGQYTYGLDQINAPDVWEQFNTTGEGVSVAVLDTGVDADHPDIDLAEDGWAFFDADGNMVDVDPFDPNGHGTHVSGIVAGGSSGGAHIGVAPGADLYNAKVLDNGGTFAQIIAGMEWAIEQGVDVINMSLGATGFFDAYIDPVQSAIELGTLVVTSAGNSGPGSSGSPGNVYDTFSIGASNANRDIAGFSSGDLVQTEADWDAWWLVDDWPINYYVPDVSAPGVSVLSSYPNGSYARLSGTSMASPHTAGATALLLGAADGLTNEEAQEYLTVTSRHGGGPDATPGPRYGEGIIDALAAAAAATDGNVVEGTVTDANGSPVPGATVETAFGTDIETGADGSFELYVADGNWELTVDQFGYGTVTESVDVSGGETVTQDVTLDLAVDVAPLSGQADVMGLNETFKFSVVLANVESLTVDVTGDTNVDTDSLTVVVKDQQITLGEEVTFPEPVSGSVQITVGTQDPGTGQFGLVHEFDGPDGPLTVETGPTEVMVDPDPAFFEIVEWGQTENVEIGGTLNEYCIVENAGDRTATQDVAWWLGDPNGINVFPTRVTLQGGEQVEIPFPIGIPAAFVPPGAQIPHGWFTDDQLVETLATFVGAGFQITGVDAPARVDRGATLELTATVFNFGSQEGGSTLNYSFDGVFVDSADVSAAPGETDTATFEFDTSRVVRGEYQHALSTAYDATDPIPIRVGPSQGPPAIVGDSEPRDLDGDGLFEDVDGDGQFTVSDVQVFFQNLDSDVVQNNAQFFNFDGEEPAEVTIGDVQALFQLLQE